jgi:hypothetical protein
MTPRSTNPTIQVLLAVSIACSRVYAQDAEVLQQTLAKIVFAHDVDIITQLEAKKAHRATAEEVQQPLAAEPLEFTVADFSEGPVSAIASRKLTELVTWLPGIRMLDVGNSTMTVSNEKGVVGNERQAPVYWNGGGAPRPPFPDGYTLEEVAKFNPRYAGCSRYISATLTASYKGQTTEWKPLYFLGCSDNEMQALVLVMREAVPLFWKADVYPHSLLVPGGLQGRLPGVQEWLYAHASDSCSGTKTCYENGRIVIPKANIPAPYSFPPKTSSTTPVPLLGSCGIRPSGLSHPVGRFASRGNGDVGSRGRWLFRDQKCNGLLNEAALRQSCQCYNFAR